MNPAATAAAASTLAHVQHPTGTANAAAVSAAQTTTDNKQPIDPSIAAKLIASDGPKQHETPAVQVAHKRPSSETAPGQINALAPQSSVSAAVAAPISAVQPSIVPVPTPVPAINSTAGSGGLLDGVAASQPQSVTVTHNLLLSQPNSRIVHRADASGLVSTSKDDDSIKPPPISKEVIEWLSHERLNKNQANIELHKEIESQRFELMLQRQVNAARQMRLASRMEASLMRDQTADDFSDQVFQSEVS